MTINTSSLPETIKDRVQIFRECDEPEDLADRFEKILRLRLIPKKDLSQFGRGLATGVNEHVAAYTSNDEVIFIDGEDGENSLPKTLHPMLDKGRDYINRIVHSDLPLHPEATPLPAHIAYIVEKKGLSPNTIASLTYALGVVDLEIDGSEYSFSDDAIRCEVSRQPIVRVNRKSVSIEQDAIPETVRATMKGKPLGSFIGIEHMEGTEIKSLRTAQGFTTLMLALD